MSVRRVFVAGLLAACGSPDTTPYPSTTTGSGTGMATPGASTGAGVVASRCDSVAALSAAPIVPARWISDRWIIRLGRRPTDLSARAHSRLTACDLPALGVGELEPTLSLFRVGAEPCTVAITGYELSPSDQLIARDGHYDETQIVALATGCQPAATVASPDSDAPTAWLVAPSYLAARADGSAWRLIAVDVTNADNFGDEGPKPRRQQKPVPPAYRFMKHRDDECGKDCYIEWQVRRLAVEPPIEQVRITMNQWSDAGMYFDTVLSAGVFTTAGKKPQPITFPSRTISGAFVVGTRATVVLFDDGSEYASAVMQDGRLEPELVSFVHERVGY